MQTITENTLRELKSSLLDAFSAIGNIAAKIIALETHFETAQQQKQQHVQDNETLHPVVSTKFDDSCEQAICDLTKSKQGFGDTGTPDSKILNHKQIGSVVTTTVTPGVHLKKETTILRRLGRLINKNRSCLEVARFVINKKYRRFIINKSRSKRTRLTIVQDSIPGRSKRYNCLLPLVVVQKLFKRNRKTNVCNKPDVRYSLLRDKLYKRRCNIKWKCSGGKALSTFNKDEEKHNAKTFVDDHVVSDDSATAYLYTPPTRDTRQVDGELHIPVTFQTLHPAQAHSDAEEQKLKTISRFFLTTLASRTQILVTEALIQGFGTRFDLTPQQLKQCNHDDGVIYLNQVFTKIRERKPDLKAKHVINYFEKEAGNRMMAEEIRRAIGGNVQ